MLKKQRDATDGGTLTASEGSCGSAAPGVGAPSATERAAQLEMTDGGVTLRPKGAVGLLHRKGSPVCCTGRGAPSDAGIARRRD